MAYRPLSAVVLAAGEGTRMRSPVPKVLHPICGRPMLLHVLDTLVALPLERIVIVVGHGAEGVTKTVQEQLATEHRLAESAATLLTIELDDPTGYGRIVRDERDGVLCIVEQADANDAQLGLTEVNPSIYCFRRAYLAPALRRLSPENAPGEYYLTDVISVLRSTGHPIVAVTGDDATETMGVNDRAQLAAAEAVLRARINDAWMREGVSMRDPARTYVDASVELEPDVQLLPGVILEGRTAIGRGSVIGPDCRLVDTIVGERVVIQQSVARESEIGDGATIGPWASLRPGTRVGADAHIGTFVETKNADIGEGVKVPHLAYIGDAEIGPRANIGAGTITANYDGKSKHRTRVGADARIGSNTVLVAPVEIGDGAYTGAGAVVSRDVPPGALAKGVPARIEEGWAAERDAADEESDRPT